METEVKTQMDPDKVLRLTTTIIGQSVGSSAGRSLLDYPALLIVDRSSIFYLLGCCFQPPMIIFDENAPSISIKVSSLLPRPQGERERENGNNRGNKLDRFIRNEVIGRAKHGLIRRISDSLLLCRPAVPLSGGGFRRMAGYISRDDAAGDKRYERYQ